MIYIDPAPNTSGAYPNPKNQPFSECIPLDDEQAAIFFKYNGFVTVENGIVTPNTDAWEAWKASLPPEPEPEPEPEPTLEDRVSTLETSKADQTSVDELNEALNMILTGVTE